RRVREVAHTKLIEPLQRTGPLVPSNHDIDQKLLCVHGIRLPLLAAGGVLRQTVKMVLRSFLCEAAISFGDAFPVWRWRLRFGFRPRAGPPPRSAATGCVAQGSASR